MDVGVFPYYSSEFPSWPFSYLRKYFYSFSIQQLFIGDWLRCSEQERQKSLPLLSLQILQEETGNNQDKEVKQAVL